MKKGTIQKLHQPIHHIAGAMCFWVTITLTELIAFSAQVQGMALHHAVRECRLGPCPQAPQTLGKSPFTRSVIPRVQGVRLNHTIFAREESPLL